MLPRSNNFHDNCLHIFYYILEKKYAVTDVMEGAEYEFRVIAINTCGPGEPSGPSDYVFARDPQSKIKQHQIF